MNDDVTASLARRRTGLAYLFQGDDGLRAGWSLSLFVVLVVLLVFAVNAIVPPAGPLRGPQPPVAVIRTDATLFSVIALASFLVGLFEEYLTRGFLQFSLARGVAGIVAAVAPRSRWARTIGFWVAAAVFSVGIFAAGHLANKGETTVGIIGVALAGLNFVYVLYRTGSLWWAIGFHATWDWAQSYLYGVHDSGLAMEGHLLASHPAGATLLSGGATGPEGSIVVVPVLLLTMLVIRTTLPRRATAFDA